MNEQEAQHNAETVSADVPVSDAGTMGAMTCDSILFESGNGFVISCDRVKDHPGPHATFDLERLIVWCRDWEYEKVPDPSIAEELGVRYERGRLRQFDGRV